MKDENLDFLKTIQRDIIDNLNITRNRGCPDKTRWANGLASIIAGEKTTCEICGAPVDDDGDYKERLDERHE